MKKLLVLLTLFLFLFVSCSNSTSTEEISSSQEWEKGFEELLSFGDEKPATNPFVAKVDGTKDLTGTSVLKLNQKISYESKLNLSQTIKNTLKDSPVYEAMDKSINANYELNNMTSVLTPDWSIQFTKGYKDFGDESSLFIPGITYEVTKNGITYFTEYTKGSGNDYAWSEWTESGEYSLYNAWLQLYQLLGSADGYKNSKLSDGAYVTKIYLSLPKDEDSDLSYSLKEQFDNQDYMEVMVKFNKDKKVSSFEILDSTITFDFLKVLTDEEKASFEGLTSDDYYNITLKMAFKTDIEYLDSWSFDKKVPEKN